MNTTLVSIGQGEHNENIYLAFTGGGMDLPRMRNLTETQRMILLACQLTLRRAAAVLLEELERLESDFAPCKETQSAIRPRLFIDT